MSKLSQLKQEAYQAGKKRDWEGAAAIYERILELDRNNPTTINELGDLCLKADQTERAIKHFLNAAAKYRNTGLLNNAVAIYKKILRYDEENLNAHWYLAETRAGQGLELEGEEHVLRFLEGSEQVSGDIKEIFLKRCAQLLELYPDSRHVQERLLPVFRLWEMPLEASRVRVLQACQLFDAGECDAARQAVEAVVTDMPAIQSYAEYAAWTTRIGAGPDVPSAGFADVNTLALDDAPPAAASGSVAPSADEAPEVCESSTRPDVEPPAVDSETSFAGLAPEDPDTPVVDPADVDRDEEGCFELDLDGDLCFDDILDQATSGLPKDDTEEFMTPTAPDSEPADDAESGGGVDLLAEILADDDGLDATTDQQELETIASEIGAQVGGDEDETPERIYEMGLVYLDMGLHDQACASFERAAADDEYAVRAYEMWGITLLRSERPEEAIAILDRAESIPTTGSREHLGILYHLGRAQEQAGCADGAIASYEKIRDADESYLDVARRLAELAAV